MLYKAQEKYYDRKSLVPGNTSLAIGILQGILYFQNVMERMYNHENHIERRLPKGVRGEQERI